MKKLVLIFSLFLSLIFLCGAEKIDVNYVIDAEKNAAQHNNMGLVWLKERYYYGAIKEFQIAIGLNPNTQAAAVYYNNLGNTYIAMGYPDLAEENFANAIKKYPLNFSYYENLVDAIAKQNNLAVKLNYYKKNRRNNLDDILIGLIYGAMGKKEIEVTMLDEFCANEPDLIITPAVQKYVQEQAKMLSFDKKNIRFDK
jgi:tetratricopeptide (TPR) repeat protein